LTENVLIVHCQYKQRGGEETVVANEAALLKKYGHHVEILSFENRELSPISAVTRQFYHPKFWRAFNAKLAQRKFDVLHAHNLWPQAPLAMFQKAKENGIATVHTHHNYRASCANGLMLRDGRTCTLCASGSTHNAIRHKCYRNSYGACLFAVHRNRRFRRVAQTDIDVSIALTAKAKSILVQSGFSPHKIAVKPNFVGADPEALDLPVHQREGCLFVGRFSNEQGVALALEAARAYPQIPFTFIGDGPHLNWVREKSLPNLTLTGWLSKREISAYMTRSKLLLLPSQFMEGMPMVALEAMAHDLPILTLEHLAFVAAQNHKEAIATAPDAATFLQRLAVLYRDDKELARRAENARCAFATSLDEKSAYDALLRIYKSVCQ
jgi:glycosyltransferase involved in cell wall biosynthesis